MLSVIQKYSYNFYQDHSLWHNARQNLKTKKDIISNFFQKLIDFGALWVCQSSGECKWV